MKWRRKQRTLETFQIWFDINRSTCGQNVPKTNSTVLSWAPWPFDLYLKLLVRAYDNVVRQCVKVRPVGCHHQHAAVRRRHQMTKVQLRRKLAFLNLLQHRQTITTRTAQSGQCTQLLCLSAIHDPSTLRANTRGNAFRHRTSAY